MTTKDTTKPAEPTMEEILASIRRIIAEDGDEKAPGAATKPAGAAEEEILELTEMVDDNGAVTSLAQSTAAPAAVPPPRPAAPRAEPARDDDRLISPAVAAASAAALAQISARAPRDPRRDNPLPIGQGLTVEDIVRELLRPILREWIDVNLPPLVERVVREEIAKLVNDTGGR